MISIKISKIVYQIVLLIWKNKNAAFTHLTFDGYYSFDKNYFFKNDRKNALFENDRKNALFENDHLTFNKEKFR